MNRADARQLAETVSVADLKQMFVNVERGFNAWEIPSRVNMGMTKGTTFNILTKCGIDENTSILAKTNMIWEFGEYLPNVPTKDKKVKAKINPVHQEPNKLDEDFFDELINGDWK